MARQSPDADAARVLQGHAVAVAADRSLPDHIRAAAITTAEQAQREIENSR